MTFALIVVDVQNDFMPGGNLAVPNGDEVIQPINQLMRYTKEAGGIVVATLDWHPPAHGSFASTHGAKVMSMGELDGLPQVMWPDHCVQNTPGSLFHKGLSQPLIDHVVRKGEDPDVDSYSGFFDNAQRNDTGLNEYLTENGVETVSVCGLARDYCVAFTAIDAANLGYETCLVYDACRAVDFPENNDALMLKKMVDSGVDITTTDKFINS